MSVPQTLLLLMSKLSQIKGYSEGMQEGFNSDQYTWMHRRWKSRPRFEQGGKPMPANLQHKLEMLPWMDQATLDRLKNPLELTQQVYR